MSRRLQLTLFAVGAALLASLLHRIGTATLATDIARTGWWLLPIALSYLPVYALNARSLQLILADEPQRLPYRRLLAITISGFALNYLTPVLSLGGEPYRAAAIAPWVGSGRAAGAVVVFTILHALANLIFWLSAIAAALLFLRPALLATLVLLALGALIAVFAAFLFGRLRKGGVVSLLALLRRVPLLRRAAGRLAARGEALAAIDLQITGFYRRDRRRFVHVLALEYLARLTTSLEFWFIFLSLGLPLGPGYAFLISAAYSLVRNLLFFIPFELGSREGGLYALLQLVAGAGGSGVAAGIITRVRELAWIAVGLLLLWARAPAPVEPEPEPEP